MKTYNRKEFTELVTGYMTPVEAVKGNYFLIMDGVRAQYEWAGNPNFYGTWFKNDIFCFETEEDMFMFMMSN